MAQHPQNSPRGLFSKKEISIAVSGKVYFESYSDTTGLLSANSTGLKVYGAIYPSNAAAKITGNSTAVIASALAIGSKASYITSNSTGIKIGSRYISTNTTGNSAT